MLLKRAVVILALLAFGAVLTTLRVEPDVESVGNSDPQPANSQLGVTQRIDALLSDEWRERGWELPKPATDQEFVRRAYLDLTGCVPRISESQSFLRNTLPDRRAALINDLLQRPGHAKHLADIWTNNLLPEDSSLSDFIAREGLRNWLRDGFWARRGFDVIVSELLAADSEGNEGPTFLYLMVPVTPAALASHTSRSLLGTELECAECHDHPFADWKRSDFWSFAAFFSNVRLRTKSATGDVISPRLEDVDGPELVIPGTKQIVRPRFLDGETALETEGRTRRQVLATWCVSTQNPYFPRAAVNRTWAMLFGDPLVESLDDLDSSTPSVRAVVLDELTSHFIDSRFDLRELIRVVVNTKAYQATSRSRSSEMDEDLFYRKPVRSLSADQLHESLRSVVQQRYDSRPREDWGLAIDLEKMSFVRRLQSIPSGAGYHGEVHQALVLLNGERIAAATDWKRNPLITSLLAAELDDEHRVINLFLATITRTPTPTETAECIAHLQDAETNTGRGEALADVLWALLNTTEFALNH